MELGGGDGGGDDESEGNLVKLSSDDVADEDHLSALPDDALVIILLHLSTRDAVRTSVLSHRWRRIWALLPSLVFDSNINPHQIRYALQSHEADLQCLVVVSRDTTAESVATWISVAVQRLSGCFYFKNVETERITEEGDEDFSQEGDEEISQEGDEEITQESEEEDEATQRGAFELPCLEHATSVELHLGFLGLTMPPVSVFNRLRKLWLSSIHIQGPVLLGDTVSSQRCPCLQMLTVCDAHGLDNLAIHSNSLQKLELNNVRGLRKLTIMAPSLEDLKVAFCFYYSQSQPIASITAPQLATLMWSDLYDPSSVHLGTMEHLRLLKPFAFIVYGDNSVALNPSCLSLLQRFKAIEHLILTFYYQKSIDNSQYMMEDMTMLLDITILDLNIIASGHCYGACVFHVLRMCSGIKRLMLTVAGAEEPTPCPPGCICTQQQNWKTEHLLLNHLEEVEIDQFRGFEQEFTFVKQLFVWASALEKMTVNFDNSVTESMAKELGQVLLSFSRPEIHMKIRRRI